MQGVDEGARRFVPDDPPSDVVAVPRWIWPSFHDPARLSRCCDGSIVSRMPFVDVLLVEDDIKLSRALDDVLAHRRFRFSCCGDGAEAVAPARRRLEPLTVPVPRPVLLA
jgi:hypothetical protein